MDPRGTYGREKKVHRAIIMSGPAAIVGKPFVDFDVTNMADNSEGKLSDYVGKGQPVVIDFYTSCTYMYLQHEPHACDPAFISLAAARVYLVGAHRVRRMPRGGQKHGEAREGKRQGDFHLHQH